MAGGAFGIAGGVRAYNIARWDGSVWSSLSSEVSAGVDAMAFDSADNLYVAGYFSTAGGYSSANIAIWQEVEFTHGLFLPYLPR